MIPGNSTVSSCGPNRDAYVPFGRGTKAGAAIFNLYHRRNMDSTLDPVLLARLQEMRKLKLEEERLAVKPAVVPKSRAFVNVPRPNGGRSSSAAPPSLPAKPGRKPLATIKEQISVDAEGDATAQAPMPKRKLITDQDKTKLQQICEFGYVLPPPAAASTGASIAAAARRRNHPYTIKLARFHELRAVIDEHKQYLTELRPSQEGASGVPPVAAHLPGTSRAAQLAMQTRKVAEQEELAKIADAIAEMKELDEWLNQNPPPSA